MSSSQSAPEGAAPGEAKPVEPAASSKGESGSGPRPSSASGSSPLAATASTAAEGVVARRVRDTERAPPPPTGLEPEAIIADRYRVISLLGEGGMGKVYRAEHVHMRKQVAVKVLHNDVTTTPEVIARFEREAVAAGNIAHPNVAQATDFGRLDDGSFFLVLEFVPGIDLRGLVKLGPMAPDRAVKIVRQIVAAASAAHDAGVIHRDLKPENIMLVEGKGDEDFVKVLDFGIAKIDAVGLVDPEGATHAPTSGPQPITKMGTVFGTPDYMSPEQAMGQAIDARADLYSIGIILYELLSGSRPFRGGAVSLMRKHVLQDAPPLPPDIAAISDPRLQAILKKLLQKSPSDRYTDAAALAAALDEVVSKTRAGLASSTGPSAAAASVVRTPSAPASTLPALPLARKKRSAAPWLFLAVVVLLGAGFTWVRYGYVVGVPFFAAVPWISPPPIAAAPVAPPSVASVVATASAPPMIAVSASATASAAASSVDAASAAPSTSDAQAAEADDEADDEAFDGGAATAVAHAIVGGAPPRHGSSHPAHSTTPNVHHGKLSPQQQQHPAARHTGPGGIYIPPPNQWFK